MTEDKPLDWKAPPNVFAPSPHDKSETVKYRVSNDIIAVGKPGVLKTPLYQTWVHLLNRKPPITNASALDLSDNTPTYCTLAESSACFCGVKRPYRDQENGSGIVVYVLKPKVTVMYAPKLTAPIETKVVDPSYVLTVSVLLSKSSESSETIGIVTRIEMVKCDAANDTLPKGHETRYEKRLW